MEAKCDGFKDDEYLMEESLQKTRIQLITMLEEDECLQCLGANNCRCSDTLQPQDYQLYQLFDYRVQGQLFQVPPPASQVPKPYWIHGNWSPNEDLEQRWAKINAEKRNRSWEIAKASADLILTAKMVEEEAKKSKNKIADWFEASERQKERVTRNDKEYKEVSTELTPVWTPTEQSPWYQKTNKTKDSKTNNNTVEEFFKKFASKKQLSIDPKRQTQMQAAFVPMPYQIVAPRMNVACNGIQTRRYVTSVGLQTNCAM